jgi:hypothetical protein
MGSKSRTRWPVSRLARVGCLACTASTLLYAFVYAVMFENR